MSYHNLGPNGISKAIISYKKCYELLYRECALKLASIYRDMNDYRSVQIYLHQAIEWEPTNYNAYNYLGDTYNNLQQFQLAIDNYNLSIHYLEISKLSFQQIISEKMTILTSLGDTYLNKKEYLSAYNSYNKGISLITQYKALEDHPSALGIWIGSYFASLEIGNWIKQIEYHDKIINLAIKYNNIQYQYQLPPNPLSPYRLLFLNSPPKLHLNISKQWYNGLISKKINSITHNTNNNTKLS
jgi:tetratricopeptide (TPR) repeat protein